MPKKKKIFLSTGIALFALGKPGKTRKNDIGGTVDILKKIADIIFTIHP